MVEVFLSTYPDHTLQWVLTNVIGQSHVLLYVDYEDEGVGTSLGGDEVEVTDNIILVGTDQGTIDIGDGQTCLVSGAFVSPAVKVFRFLSDGEGIVKIKNTEAVVPQWSNQDLGIRDWGLAN